MKMAKATEDDIAAALLLNGILEDVDDGDYPREVPGDGDVEAPVHFDPENPEHLKVFYRRVMHCVKVRPSGISRVVWGMATILDNDILDPDLKHLELHPRFDLVSNAAQEAHAAILGAREAFEPAMNFVASLRPEVVEVMYRLREAEKLLADAIADKGDSPLVKEAKKRAAAAAELPPKQGEEQEAPQHG